MLDASRELTALLVGKSQKLARVFDRGVRRRYLEQQRAVVACLGDLGAHRWPVDEAFAWNHVIHKVADPIRQLDGDQPVPKLRQQVHRVRPADLIVRRVVAKPEPSWIERVEGSTNQLGRRPGQHIFQRQADVRRRQDRNKIFTSRRVAEKVGGTFEGVLHAGPHGQGELEKYLVLSLVGSLRSLGEGVMARQSERY